MEKNILKLSNYVTVTENHSKHFSTTDIVRICKRMNNSKRDFLFVNPVQGKHLHVEPSKSISLFEELVEEIINHVDLSEKIIVIGFAETATAIGHYIASRLPNCIYYMQTTREILSNAKPVLEFKEEHSHATEQLLYGDVKALQECDRIIFVDDEISTGNTILNFIREIEKIGISANYGVASILNWQNDDWTIKFSEHHIKTFYIIRGKLSNLKATVPVPISNLENMVRKVEGKSIILKVHCDISDFSQERIGMVPYEFTTFAKTVYSQIALSIENYLPKTNESVLVLGTEEYMFTPMVFGKMLAEKQNVNVQFHATTRSPIETSSLDFYAIKRRFSVTSCYDTARNTYVYNLQKYDKVYIITDVIPNEDFITDISSALINTGCESQNIVFIILKG